MAIPPVVARIFSGDSTSPLTRDGHGCPKLNAQSFARMRNQQSVHMARVIVLFEGLCGKGGHGGEMLVLLKHYCFTAGRYFNEC